MTAILLDSYDLCSVDQAWSLLNADWSQYGSVPVSITTGGSLCAGQFNLADLEASGADTVVISDSAWTYTWTPTEIDALQTYLDEGHTLVGLGVDFQWHRHDDGALAPLFGLATQQDWDMGGPGGAQQPTYQLRPHNPAAPVLFRDVSNPYVSSGAGNDVERPASGKWTSSALAGATYAGLSRQHKSVITVYNAATYEAVYIASAAWYQSTPDDLQFLYNALIYPNEG